MDVNQQVRHFSVFNWGVDIGMDDLNQIWIAFTHLTPSAGITAL